jgi:hypothetical protein
VLRQTRREADNQDKDEERIRQSARSARNLLLPLSSRPNATKPRKQIMLAMFDFTV